MMTRNLRPQHTILSTLCLFIVLSGMLSSCRPIAETPNSTGGVDIELTPTVEEPVAQELTLVSPTEAMTEMPTLTLTPEPSPTATIPPTETPIPTEVEKYPIDLEKLSTTPESYQYLLDNKEKFVKGPDPLEVGMEEFFKWYSEKLIPSLGDYKERDGNLYYNQVAVGEEKLAISGNNLDRSIMGQMEFWYFEHGGVVYPVLEFAGIKDEKIGYNIGVVLVEQLGIQNLGAIKDIKDGQKDFWGVTIFVKDREIIPVSEDVHRMLEEGFFYYNGHEHYFGIGAINFFES
jgi:hypothetical protein